MAKNIDAAALWSQHLWSVETFGPGYRPGTLKHLEKELEEIRENIEDVEEYADGLILLLDDAMRAGHRPEEIIDAYHAKRLKNTLRTWPDWRTMPLDQPIEHVRHDEAMHELKRVEFGTY